MDEPTALLMSAISVAAMQNTRESAKQRISRDSPYWTQTYGDVCAAVDREMAERERADALALELAQSKAPVIGECEECGHKIVTPLKRHPPSTKATDK